MPGKGAPHAIFLPRQKRQARGGFFSGVFFEGNELRPIDGDGADFIRNSVGGGVDGEGVTGDASDRLGCGRLLSCGESRSLRSDNRSRRMTPSRQLLGNFNVGGFMLRVSCRKL
jgi:hypothetical protein